MQSNLRPASETSSKIGIAIIWSFVLDYENKDNPFEERKQSIINWKYLAILDCDLSVDIANVAKDLMSIGLRQKYASLIACAICANADYFLTTDKKILNKPISEVKVVNHIEFVMGYLDE